MVWPAAWYPELDSQLPLCDDEIQPTASTSTGSMRSSVLWDRASNGHDRDGLAYGVKRCWIARCKVVRSRKKKSDRRQNLFGLALGLELERPPTDIFFVSPWGASHQTLWERSQPKSIVPILPTHAVGPLEGGRLSGELWLPDRPSLRLRFSTRVSKLVQLADLRTRVLRGS